MSVLSFRRKAPGPAAPEPWLRRLAPVPGFSDPAPVQFADRRLAAIEADMATVAVDLAALRRALERLAGDEGIDYDLEPEPAAPAWHETVALAEGDPAWYGHDTTMPDQRAQMARPYAPEPFAEPVPVEADLDALPLFRDTVRAEVVRREQNAQGGRSEGGSWRDRYAGLYARLWDAPSLPDFGIDAMMAAHFGGAA